MPKQTTYIRIAKSSEWVDIFDAYGASLSDSAVSRLMTPAPNKEVVENRSDLEHGKRVTRDPNDTRKDERNFSLEIHLLAPNKDTFLERYGKFCNEVLDKGFFDIKTKYLPGTIYRVTYMDCSQFTEWGMGMAKFTLNLNEPDPTNRSETDKWEQ